MALTINDLVASTLFHQREETADTVLGNDAILIKLKEKGRVKKIGGGYEIRMTEDYQGPDAQWFEGYEQLNKTPVETTTAYQYDWASCAVPCIIDGTTVRKNKGDKERLFDVLQRRVDVSRRKLRNAITTALRGDGTTGFDGLQVLYADAPSTGIVGGIDRATYTWARNVYYDISTELSESRSAANIQKAYLATWVQLVRGNDQPDLMLATNTHWSDYHASLTAIQRITNEDTKIAKAGFRTLQFMNAEVVLDGGYSGATGNRTYMLNTNYLEFIGHKDLFMTRLGGEREPVDQDAVVQYLGCMAALCGNGFPFSAVVID